MTFQNWRPASAGLLDFFSPQTFFLKISGTPALTLLESLAVFVAVFLGIWGLWYLRKPKNETPQEPGLQLLNLGEENLFIPLKAEVQSLEFLASTRTDQKLRLSANLNRVILTPYQNTFLLEDKNYKNALLINRRRSHRTILWDNDILDVGEMMLLYRNPAVPVGKIRHQTAENFSVKLSGGKPKGPVRKGTPVLAFSGNRQEIPLLRNINTLGTSDTNDIVLDGNEIASRHAKIVKVGEQWKIQNLQTQEITLVNGRRIEQRFLHDGDEVTTGSKLFKFRISKVSMDKI